MLQLKFLGWYCFVQYSVGRWIRLSHRIVDALVEVCLLFDFDAKENTTTKSAHNFPLIRIPLWCCCFAYSLRTNIKMAFYYKFMRCDTSRKSSKEIILTNTNNVCSRITFVSFVHYLFCWCGFLFGHFYGVSKAISLKHEIFAMEPEIVWRQSEKFDNRKLLQRHTIDDRVIDPPLRIGHICFCAHITCT